MIVTKRTTDKQDSFTQMKTITKFCLIFTLLILFSYQSWKTIIKYQAGKSSLQVNHLVTDVQYLPNLGARWRWLTMATFSFPPSQSVKTRCTIKTVVSRREFSLGSYQWRLPAPGLGRVSTLYFDVEYKSSEIKTIWNFTLFPTFPKGEHFLSPETGKVSECEHEHRGGFQQISLQRGGRPGDWRALCLSLVLSRLLIEETKRRMWGQGWKDCSDRTPPGMYSGETWWCLVVRHKDLPQQGREIILHY